MKLLKWAWRAIEATYLSLGLIVLTLVAAFALHVNTQQTANIRNLLVRADTEAIRLDTESCISRQEGREALRQLIALISTSPNITSERQQSYRMLLDDLPPVICDPHTASNSVSAPKATPNKESIIVSNWSPEKIAAILGAIIPVLTALSTHFAAASKVKATIAFVLAFIAGPVVTFIQTNQSLISWASARSGLVAWGVALLTYLGAWKPILALNSKALPDKGIGAPPKS